nr:hypothetical protein [Tanacetum cinerariifolium]
EFMNAGVRPSSSPKSMVPSWERNIVASQHASKLEEELVGSKKEAEKLRKERGGLEVNLGQADIVRKKMFSPTYTAWCLKGVKIGRKKESVKVIMQDTSNLDVAAPSMFEWLYKAFFGK